MHLHFLSRIFETCQVYRSFLFLLPRNRKKREYSTTFTRTRRWKVIRKVCLSEDSFSCTREIVAAMFESRQTEAWTPSVKTATNTVPVRKLLRYCIINIVKTCLHWSLLLVCRLTLCYKSGVLIFCSKAWQLFTAITRFSNRLWYT